MKTSDTKVYKEMILLARQLENYIVNFKHEIKYSYGQSLRLQANEIIKEICMANTATTQESRVYHLSTAIGNFESYKFMLRMVYFTKDISKKQAAILEERVGSIGCQLGGWKRYAERQMKLPPDIVMSKDFENQLKNGTLIETN